MTDIEPVKVLSDMPFLKMSEEQKAYFIATIERAATLGLTLILGSDSHCFLCGAEMEKEISKYQSHGPKTGQGPSVYTNICEHCYETEGERWRDLR